MLEQNLVNVFGINDKVEYQIVENISIEKNGKYKPIKFHEEELVWKKCYLLPLLQDILKTFIRHT